MYKNEQTQILNMDHKQTWVSKYVSPCKTNPTIPFNSAGRVTQLVRQFNEIWKRAIETMNGEVMKSFSNFRNGTQILQVMC